MSDLQNSGEREKPETVELSNIVCEITEVGDLVDRSLGLLGLRGRDRVTGYEGVVSSVCFDLYGCVQLILTGKTGWDGKLQDCGIFDIKRVEILSTTPVMKPPDFATANLEPFSQGPAEKPAAMLRP